MQAGDQNDREFVESWLPLVCAGIIVAGFYGAIYIDLLAGLAVAGTCIIPLGHAIPHDRQTKGMVRLLVGVAIFEAIYLPMKLAHIKDLDNKGKEIENRAAAALERAALANERATSNELARVEILKAISPRTFLGQFEAITNLTRFKGTKVRITYEPNDVEAERTAQQIRWVLERAGWQVIFGGNPMPLAGRRGEFPPTRFDLPAEHLPDVGIREGVSVESAVDRWRGMGGSNLTQLIQATGVAASALRNELRVGTIETTATGPLSLIRMELLEWGVVLVHVGRRPPIAGVEGWPFYRAR